MKKIFLSLFVMMIASLSYGQNMAIYKAEEQMNDGKLTQAEATIAPALGNPKTKLVAYAYNVAGNIESRLLQQEIQKAASKQPLDTTLFINSLNKAVEYFTASDKAEKTPDAKGKLDKSQYHENNVTMLKQIISSSYYAYAGQFENQRGNRQGAYKAFEQFLALPKNPVFSKEESAALYKENESTYNKIGYYASMLAFEMKDYDGVLENVDFAIADTTERTRNDGYVMKLSALLAKKDTAGWVKVSRNAVAAIDDNPEYCNNLLYYYSSRNLKNEAKAMADTLIEKAPSNKMAWYAHGCVLMNTFKQYAESRKDFDKAIEMDPNFTEAIYNKGVSIVNELISLNLNTNTKAKDYNQIVEKARSYYRQAQPLFEKVRELAPTHKELWAENLRSIYYNLEMKDKAKEMENIITSN